MYTYKINIRNALMYVYVYINIITSDRRPIKTIVETTMGHVYNMLWGTKMFSARHRIAAV